MIAVDTSVLSRYILHDTPTEHEAAAKFLSTNSCAVGWSVLIELGWVLERSAGLPRHEVIDAIWAITNLDQVSVPDQEKLDWVLERYAAGADFADMIHLVAAMGGSSEFATFDRKLEKQAGQNTPLPIQTLRA